MHIIYFHLIAYKRDSFASDLNLKAIWLNANIYFIWCLSYVSIKLLANYSCTFGRYYEGGISSVYMWEDENEGFVACFLIKKGVFLSIALGQEVLYNSTNLQ